MSDPSTLLLLTCVTCTDIPDSPPQADSVCTQPQRQNQGDGISAASPCISPPESIRASAPVPTPAVRFAAARATEEIAYTAVAPRPAPPERSAQLPAANRSESSPAVDAAPLLQFGNQSKTVGQLQERLRQLGYYKGALDGVYGDLTVEAVSAFQQAEGLEVDGIVGRSTWARLQQLPRSSAEEKKPGNPPANIAPPEQKREAAPSQNPPPKLDIPLLRPKAPPEQRPVEPSPMQPSPRLAEPPAMVGDDADLGQAYLWMSGWALAYIGGFLFIYRLSNRHKRVSSLRPSQVNSLEADQSHPAQPVQTSKKAEQPHPAQPVQTSKQAEPMPNDNAPPFSSRAIFRHFAQPPKLGATTQPLLRRSRRLKSPPQSSGTRPENFSRNTNSRTAKNSSTNSTATHAPQKTASGTPQSTEHQLVAVPANEGVAEPLKNLLLDLPGASKANVPQQKEDKVSSFQKAVNRKSDQSSSASKAAPRGAEEASTQGALVAMLPPRDPATGMLYTYSLVGSAGGRFKLKGNELRINDETLFESQDTISHTIVVGRTDGKGTYAEKSFVLNFTKSRADTRNVSKRPA